MYYNMVETYKCITIWFELISACIKNDYASVPLMYRCYRRILVFVHHCRCVQGK